MSELRSMKFMVVLALAISIVYGIKTNYGVLSEDIRHVDAQKLVMNVGEEKILHPDDVGMDTIFRCISQHRNEVDCMPDALRILATKVGNEEILLLGKRNGREVRVKVKLCVNKPGEKTCQED